MTEFDRAPYEEKFIDYLRKRLNEGAVDYGNKSFTGSLRNTIAEIQEELTDVAGWAFIGWTKLEILREKMKAWGVENLEAPHEKV